MRDGNEMNRFFKAYFIGSLIYAVVFGLLVYGVGLLFSGFECFDIDADNEQYAEYCSRAHEMSAFEKVSLKFFFFPFLSVMLLSLLNAGIMKWTKRCTTFDDSCLAYHRMVDCLVCFFTVEVE